MVYTANINNNLSGIANRIELLFADRNVKMVLDELGISQTTYYRSIKTNNWKLEHVANIAEYFKVSTDYIIFGKEPNTELERKVKELTESSEVLRKSLLVLLKEKETVNV